ncbi:MAG TPA: VWA domain-containing protein [Dehalococcoidia bacterium]|nr:VWA domain-containing protein [Dehalococcoidia bacterium]
MTSQRITVRLGVLLAALLLALAITGSALAAVGGSSSVTSGAEVTGDGIATVELELNATSVTAVAPTDIFILLDASGSVGSTNFALEKDSAEALVASLGDAGLFANGGRVGIIRFASSSTVMLSLNSDEITVRTAILGTPYTRGGTCATCAITQATAEFNSDSPPGSHRIMILITDGRPNSLQSAAAAAATAEFAGIERFAVAIGQGIRLDDFDALVSDPVEEHLVFAEDFGTLGDLADPFAAVLTEPVTRSGAVDIEVLATVASRFGPASNVSASKGTATISGQELLWEIDELSSATVPIEAATLAYDITVSCDQGPSGTLALHDSITYTDANEGVVTFDLLSVTLRGCDTAIDIGPGTLSLNGNGVVPVTLLGSAGFDVAEVDPGTVLFGLNGDDAAPVHDGHIGDANDDGIDDIVFHFREGDLGIDPSVPGETVLTLSLTGSWLDGTTFEADDTVRIAPNNPHARSNGNNGNDGGNGNSGVNPGGGAIGNSDAGPGSDSGGSAAGLAQAASAPDPPADPAPEDPPGAGPDPEDPGSSGQARGRGRGGRH